MLSKDSCCSEPTVKLYWQELYLDFIDDSLTLFQRNIWNKIQIAQIMTRSLQIKMIMQKLITLLCMKHRHHLLRKLLKESGTVLEVVHCSCRKEEEGISDSHNDQLIFWGWEWSNCPAIIALPDASHAKWDTTWKYFGTPTKWSYHLVDQCHLQTLTGGSCRFTFVDVSWTETFLL